MYVNVCGWVLFQERAILEFPGGDLYGSSPVFSTPVTGNPESFPWPREVYCAATSKAVARFIDA